MKSRFSPLPSTGRIVLFALLSIAGPASAHGGLITTLWVEQSAEPNGGFLYQYALINHEECDLPLVSFLLAVPPAADLRGLAGPQGWETTYAPGDLAVLWFSPSAEFDLRPGDGALFSFVSPLAAGMKSFQITGLDLSVSEIAVAEGEIAGPGMLATPEPSTLTSCVLAAIVLAGFGLRRRSRAARGDPPVRPPLP